MKQKIYTVLLVIASLMLSMSCSKDFDGKELVGDWNCCVEESGKSLDIWISFSENGTFEMYQKFGEGVYWHSKGTFQVNGKGLLTGVYSDRTPWKYEYHYAVSGGTLTMIASTDESYSNTYTRKTTPQSVKDKCLDLTKASAVEVVDFWL